MSGGMLSPCVRGAGRGWWRLQRALAEEKPGPVLLSPGRRMGTHGGKVLLSRGLSAPKPGSVLLSRGLSALKPGSVLLSRGLSAPKPGSVLLSRGLSAPKPGSVLLSRGLSAPKPGSVLLSRGLSALKPGSVLLSRGLSAPKPGSVLLSRGLSALKPGSVLLSRGLSAPKPGSVLLSRGLSALKPGSVLLSPARWMGTHGGKEPKERLNSPKRAKEFIYRLHPAERACLLGQLQEFESAAAQEKQEPTAPTSRQIRYILLHNAIPFVGFGFLDNAIMIAAGTQIEVSIGVTLGISTMAAAALGNLVSDLAGLGLAGYVEALVSKLGMQGPELTPSQADLWQTRVSSHLGKAIGVSIGCILGMFPLLFISDEEEAKSEG